MHGVVGADQCVTYTVMGGGGGGWVTVYVCVCTLSLPRVVTHLPTILLLLLLLHLSGPDADVVCSDSKEQQTTFRGLIRAFRVRFHSSDTSFHSTQSPFHTFYKHVLVFSCFNMWHSVKNYLCIIRKGYFLYRCVNYNIVVT